MSALPMTRIVLDIDPDARPVSGCLEHEHGRVSFIGLVEMLVAVQAALVRPIAASDHEIKEADS